MDRVDDLERMGVRIETTKAAAVSSSTDGSGSSTPPMRARSESAILLGLNATGEHVVEPARTRPTELMLEVGVARPPRPNSVR